MVWTSWGSERQKWRDGKSRIEEQLSRIVAGFIRIALADRAAKQEQAAKEKERERLAREQSELEERLKAEKSKVLALTRAAAGWSRAEQIRSFVAAARDAAIQNGLSVEPGSPFGEWIAWAEQQADRVDPLKESPPLIIDRMREPASPSYYYYDYRKPDAPFRFPKPIWRMK